MDDVPDNLECTSILLEVIENLQNLRDNIEPLKERDDDLRNCVK